MLLLFGYAIVFTQLLLKPENQEMGWLASYGILILAIINIVLTLNPAQRVEASDLQERGCCSNSNLFITLSVVACLALVEGNYAVHPNQNKEFYRRLHNLVAVWLATLWISLQKLPERFASNSAVIQKYLSSDVFKAAVCSILVILLSLLLRD